MTVLAVHTGSADPPPAARRLRLSHAAVRWLCAHLPGEPPPALTSLVAGGILDDGNRSVVDELRTLGVLTGDDQHPAAVVGPMRVTWGVLTTPRDLVHVRTYGKTVGRVAVLATSGGYGVSAVQADSSTVELSAWMRARRRDELARLVPHPDEFHGGRSIAAALSGAASVPVPTGPVDVTDGQGLPSSDGRLDVDVMVRTGNGPGVGMVRWVCADGRWWRLVARGARVMAEPVGPGDLGSDVARLTAAASWVPTARPEPIDGVLPVTGADLNEDRAAHRSPGVG